MMYFHQTKEVMIILNVNCKVREVHRHMKSNREDADLRIGAGTCKPTRSLKFFPNPSPNLIRSPKKSLNPRYQHKGGMIR